jgi:hypothetical protein
VNRRSQPILDRQHRRAHATIHKRIHAAWRQQPPGTVCAVAHSRLSQVYDKPAVRLVMIGVRREHVPSDVRRYDRRLRRRPEPNADTARPARAVPARVSLAGRHVGTHAGRAAERRWHGIAPDFANG